MDNFLTLFSLCNKVIYKDTLSSDFSIFQADKDSEKTIFTVEVKTNNLVDILSYFIKYQSTMYSRIK
jgi:hypothetical protein